MTRKTVILGTPGYVQEPSRFGNADLLKAVGANTGNLIFQLAAARLIAGSVTHVGFSGRTYGDREAFSGLDFLVSPAANHLRSDADWTLLNKFLRQQRAPLVVLGVGAQADADADPALLAPRLRSNPSVGEFVSILRDKAVLVTVRGAFSEAVCHEMGLADVVPIGCPSQFLHASPNLGRDLRARMDVIIKADPQVRYLAYAKR